MEIEAPSHKIVGNVRAHFFGHYQRYGVNIQACCDHLSRFTYIGLAGPGVMNDNQAIHQISIGKKIANLPFGWCVIGDAAYSVTEQLVPMYYGADKLKQQYDDFNFFGSQLWIWSEMAFGMTKKWGILWRPLTIACPRYIS
jgi:DDE superfamily endonuclease